MGRSAAQVRKHSILFAPGHAKNDVEVFPMMVSIGTSIDFGQESWRHLTACFDLMLKLVVVVYRDFHRPS